jgi:hypothetical protein
MRLIVGCLLVGLASSVSAETWICEHADQEREQLKFMVNDENSVAWAQCRLGTMDPLL